MASVYLCGGVFVWSITTMVLYFIIQDQKSTHRHVNTNSAGYLLDIDLKAKFTGGSAHFASDF